MEIINVFKELKIKESEKRVKFNGDCKLVFDKEMGKQLV